MVQKRIERRFESLASDEVLLARAIRAHYAQTKSEGGAPQQPDKSSDVQEVNGPTVRGAAQCERHHASVTA